jgi:pilus assembly protein CpaF
VVLHMRRAASGRVLETVGLVAAEGLDRFVTVRPVWERSTGVCAAAGELGSLLAARGVRVPDLLWPGGR